MYKYPSFFERRPFAAFSNTLEMLTVLRTYIAMTIKPSEHDTVAEWSNALDLGSSLHWRGFKSPLCYISFLSRKKSREGRQHAAPYLYAYFSSLKPIRSLFLHWTLDNFFLLLLNCSWNFRQSDFEKKSVSQIPCQTQYRSILLYCIRSHCTFLLNVIGSDVTMVYLFSQL